MPFLIMKLSVHTPFLRYEGTKSESSIGSLLKGEVKKTEKDNSLKI